MVLKFLFKSEDQSIGNDCEKSVRHGSDAGYVGANYTSEMLSVYGIDSFYFSQSL